MITYELYMNWKKIKKQQEHNFCSLQKAQIHLENEFQTLKEKTGLWVTWVDLRPNRHILEDIDRKTGAVSCRRRENMQTESSANGGQTTERKGII
jgi:hypothetical protein